MNTELLDLMRQVKALQAQVDSLVKPEVGRWISWTPTVTQSGAVAVTVTYARYIIFGNSVIVEARLAVTGTGTAGNAIIIGGQPAVIAHGNSNSAYSIIGGLLILDTTASLHYHGALVSFGAADWRGITHNSNNFTGVSPSFALANGHVVAFQATYERA